jgi:hypothetical protein
MLSTFGDLAELIRLLPQALRDNYNKILELLNWKKRRTMKK